MGPARRPTHASYQLHQRQVRTRILLPVIAAALALIAAAVLLSLATFGSGGDVGRWAAISTIWLTVPVLILGLIALVVLSALAYGVAMLAGLIPRYSVRVQRLAFRIGSGARQAGQMVRKPVLAVRAVGALVRSRLQGLRERM